MQFCDIVKLLIAIAIPNAVSVSVYFLFNAKSLGWIAGLVYPPLQPPGWVFFPVWTVLYTCMGIASYLVFYSGGGFTGSAQVPLLVYAAFLVIDFGWNAVYFGLHDILGGLMLIIVLVTSATILEILYLKINKIAGLLIVPLVVWLTLASYLSYEIYKLNPEQIHI